MNKSKYRFQIIKKLYPFFDGSKKIVIISFVLTVALNVLSILFPVLYGIFIEDIILGQNKQKLIIVIVGYLLIQFVISIINLSKVKIKFKINKNVFAKLKVKLFENFTKIDYEEYSNIKSGDIKVIIEEDVDKLSTFADEQTINYFWNIIHSVIMGVILLVIEWRMAICACAFIPLTFLLDHIFSEKEKYVNEVLNTNDARWASWLDETAKGWKDIRINEYERKKKEEFLEFQGTDQSYFASWLRYWVTRTLVIPKVKDDFVIQFGMYFFGGILIFKGYFSIGVLLVFVQYYGMLAGSVKAVSAANAELQSNKIYFDRVMERLVVEPENVRKNMAEIVDYNIRIEDLNFKYSNDSDWIIKNLSKEIKQGDRVAIKGKSGTGKTTLVNVMLGLLKPTSGNVFYGSQNRKNILEESFFNNIVYISQTPTLYNVSIRDNLCLGVENVKEGELIAACKKARIYDFIESLTEGMETKAGENGENFSGGQKQRLLLARAFLKHAKIIILDEATSALDKNVEMKIVEALKSIGKDCTLIIIAHNDNILQICDSVIQM